MSFVSAHTGNEIDLSVASGSTTTGVIKDFTTLSGSLGSTISGSKIFIGGNTTLGNTVIVGNGIVNSITASGGISSSGKLKGSELHLNDLIISGTAGGDIFFKNVEVADSYKFLGDNNAVLLEIGPSVNQTTDGLQITQGVGKFTLQPVTSTDNITVSARNAKLQLQTVSATVVTITGSSMHVGGSTEPPEKLTVVGNISSSGFISTDSNITASGNISSSGTITGNVISTGVGENGLYNTGGGTKLMISSSNDIILNGADDIFFQSEGTTIAQIKGDEAILDLNGTLDVSSHITASGNIKTGGVLQLTSSAFVAGGQIQASGSIVSSAGIQSRAVNITATDNGSGSAQISPDTSVALINADSDANHIVVLPQPIIGNIIHLIENGTTGYELRTSNPPVIGINGGTANNAESAIAGAITYVKCVAVSNGNYICSQFDADGDESKVEAAS